MHFKDIHAGDVLHAGPRVVTEPEILEFAGRYDPQWFHTNPARANGGRWHGLIASGWHTCAIAMELIVGAVLKDSDSYGSPGIDNLKWLEAVRPGDALSLRVIVLDTRASSSGKTGIVRWRWELWNQAQRQVLELTGTSLFEIGTEST